MSVNINIIKKQKNFDAKMQFNVFNDTIVENLQDRTAELEENLDPEVTDWFEEKDCCCLSAFCTEVVMEGVRVEMILATICFVWSSLVLAKWAS